MSTRVSPAIRTSLTALALMLSTAVVCLPAVDLDWGGTIDGSGSAVFADHQDEADTSFSLTSALWLRTLIEPGAATRIEIELQPSYTWSDTRAYLVDLDRARADANWGPLFGPGTVFRSILGRFRMSDMTATVMSHTVDGADLRVSLPFMRLRAAAGYTGLVLNPASSIRMSETDAQESTDDDVFFGPRRLVAIGEATVPEVVGRQTATLAWVGQWDLRDAEEGEDTVGSQYFGARVDGPVLPGLFYELAGYTGIAELSGGSVEGTDTGILALARLRYFRSEWNATRIALTAAGVSGADFSEDSFYTISEQQAASVASLPLDNVAYGELSYGLRPFAGADLRVYRDLQTTLAVRSLLRVSIDQALDSFAADVSGDGRYIGTEATLALGWRVLSDLGTSLTLGTFLPGTGSSGAFTDERTPEYLVRMQVSASF